jgi:hypothetical protein
MVSIKTTRPAKSFMENVAPVRTSVNSMPYQSGAALAATVAGLGTRLSSSGAEAVALGRPHAAGEQRDKE